MSPKAPGRHKHAFQTVKVKVRARSGKREVLVRPDGLLEVKTTAVPEKGRANEDVVDILAEHFGVPKTQIILASGHMSSRKTFLILN